MCSELEFLEESCFSGDGVAAFKSRTNLALLFCRSVFTSSTIFPYISGCQFAGGFLILSSLCGEYFTVLEMLLAPVLILIKLSS